MRKKNLETENRSHEHRYNVCGGGVDPEVT